MKTTFYILLNVKTVDGFERYGKFDLGDDKKFAYELFARLAGQEPGDDGDDPCAEYSFKSRNGPGDQPGRR